MFSLQLNAILLVAVLTARHVVQTSDWKRCHECDSAKSARAVDYKCFSLLPTGVYAEGEKGMPAYDGPPYCYVSIVYDKASGGHPVTVNRGFAYPATTTYANTKSDPERRIKMNGGILLPECNEVKKFPAPRNDTENVEHGFVHACYCLKDLCNSAIISK